MATLTPNKTIQTPLLALQSVAASTVVIGSWFDYSAIVGPAAILVSFGRGSASASTGSAFIRIEARNAASGNTGNTILTLTTDYAAVTSQAVSGTCNSGQNVIGIGTTTNIAAGTVLFIVNGTFANSEFARVKSIVTNTSATIEENLVNAQTGSTVYTGAQIFDAQEIGAPYKSIRAVFDGSRFTQACAVRVDMITVDSMSIA